MGSQQLRRLAGRCAVKPETFTVERANWLRGTDQSMLRNPEGQMCCLGFLGLACGYTPEELLNRNLPDDFENRPTGESKDRLLWPRDLARVHEDQDEGGEYSIGTETCSRIAITNDSTFLSDASREQRLTEYFGSIGIKVVFK